MVSEHRNIFSKSLVVMHAIKTTVRPLVTHIIMAKIKESDEAKRLFLTLGVQIATATLRNKVTLLSELKDVYVNI